MKLYQTTDHHLKDEEPFFRAGVALDDYILTFLESEAEFSYLESGDRFNVAKETGRVNGEVVRFFLRMAMMPNCKTIWVLQGNHDCKVDVGSALDCIRGLHDKIQVIQTPTLIDVNPEKSAFMYLLPHMPAHSVDGYSTKKSYGDETFHRTYFPDWDSLKKDIVFVSAHLGDQTSGEFFMDADLSFIPGVHSHGHIHKTVSKNHLESASVTRRDEVDKKCRMRVFDTTDFTKMEEVELPLFLNYVRVPYGASILSYYDEKKTRIKPKTSLILDIYGHDDEDSVTKEYQELTAGLTDPKVYIGKVTPTERRLDELEKDGEGEDLDIQALDIKELFNMFCKDKGIVKELQEELEKRL